MPKETSRRSFGLPRFAHQSSLTLGLHAMLSLTHVFLSDSDLNTKSDVGYSLSPGVWQSFVTIRSCNHLMRIISTYVDNTKKSEIS